MLQTNLVAGRLGSESSIVVGQRHLDLVLEGARADVVNLGYDGLELGRIVEGAPGAAVLGPGEEVRQDPILDDILLLAVVEGVPLAAVVVGNARAVLCIDRNVRLCCANYWLGRV